MNRRNFVKFLISSGSIGLLSTSLVRFLTGCVIGSGPKPPTAGFNSNFKGPGYEKDTFYQSIWQGYTPGITFNLPPGTPIVASAKGSVRKISKKVARAGGEGLHISHARVEARLTGVRDSVYKTAYLHMNETLVKDYDEIERGQIIGYAGSKETYSVLKYTATERDRHVNPYNYGQNYSLMDYWDGHTNLDFSEDEIRERFINQKWVVKKRGDLTC